MLFKSLGYLKPQQISARSVNLFALASVCSKVDPGSNLVHGQLKSRVHAYWYIYRLSSLYAFMKLDIFA